MPRFEVALQVDEDTASEIFSTPFVSDGGLFPQEGNVALSIPCRVPDNAYAFVMCGRGC